MVALDQFELHSETLSAMFDCPCDTPRKYLGGEFYRGAVYMGWSVSMSVRDHLKLVDVGRLRPVWEALFLIKGPKFE